MYNADQPPNPPQVCEVRSFSSYTKGLHPIQNISNCDDHVELTLSFPIEFKPKLVKRFQKFKCPALSIDGVFSEVSLSEENKAAKTCSVTARVAREFFKNSALQHLKTGDKVSIGMMSSNPEKWLLDSTPIGVVTLNKVGIAEGHQHTKELSFECSEEIYNSIKDLKYIGLNASGLFVQKPSTIDGHYFFSIHAGRETREKTVFGDDNLPMGSQFTLTLPFEPK